MGVVCPPLFSTALHSSSDFCMGYDMSLLVLLLKREPRNGIAGADLSAVVLYDAPMLRDGRNARLVAFDKAEKLRRMVGRDGKRMKPLSSFERAQLRGMM